MVYVAMISAVLMLAVVEYMCQHRSVGVFRLVDDLLKRPDVKRALGIIKAALAPGSDEWWRAYYAVLEAVRSLETEGLVKYMAAAGVVNWMVGRCL